MIASLNVTIGVEVNMEDAYRIAKEYCGSIDDLSDEEILDVYATAEFSQGLGCNVEVLGID